MLTKIIGHRGSKGTVPENTLIAFEEALAVGSDGIELDVHLSADGELVVIHDETVDRTTNGRGFVKDLTVNELQMLDAGSWFHPRFSGVKIPTLADTLAFLREKKFRGTLNIELKTDILAYEGIEQKVLALVDSYTPTFQVVYSSFHYPTIERLLSLDNNVDFALLFSEKGREQKYLSNGKSVPAWHPNRKLVRRLIQAKDDQMPLLRVWTVNRTIEISALLKQGVDSIITDYPEKALRLRKMLQGE